MAHFETLIDIYELAIKNHANKELFGTKKNGLWNWITYREFGQKVEALRASLSSLGLKAGDKLALISNNRLEWAITVQAAQTLGVVYVPMYEAQQAKEWEYILNDSGAKMVAVASDAISQTILDMKDKLPELKLVLSFDDKTAASETVLRLSDQFGSKEPVPCVSRVPSDTACIIYTSGTTGNPKGVVLTHGNLATNITAMHNKLPTGAGDRALSFLPWAHVFGQTCEVLGLFALGASMAICEGPDKILDNLAETKPSILFSVPRVFNKLYTKVQSQISSKPKPVQELVKFALKAKKKSANHTELNVLEKGAVAVAERLVFSKVRDRFGGKLKFTVSGSAALSTEVAEFIDGLGIMVYEGYGLTETSPIVTSNTPDARRIGSVGRPIENVFIEISEEGEILVSGPNVMQGYYNKPEETAAVFTESKGKTWFHTGDKGRIDSEGYLYITGRIKEQYKLENGKYVVPTPLEEKLKLSPYIANVMVYGDNKPFNVALIVPNFENLTVWAKELGIPSAQDLLLTSPQVRSLIKQQIAEFGADFKNYESIKDFVLISEDFSTANGMLTPSMKIKRRNVVETHREKLVSLYKSLGVDLKSSPI